MHTKPCRTGHFVAAQQNKINTQTAWLFGCALHGFASFSIASIKATKMKFSP